MKVVLIAPPYGDIYGVFEPLFRRGFLNPPLGLCYLAACLKKTGHEVKIIDAEAEGYQCRDILRETKAYSPKLIGLTATSPEFPSACRIAEAFKKVSSIPIVIGGAHVSITGSETLEEKCDFDFGIIGEADETIVELAKAIEERSDFRNIRGLIYREDKIVVRTDNREPKKDLDNIPFPARELLDKKKYFRSVPQKGYIITTALISSRGCPYHCIYCAIDSLPGANNIRYRSARNVVDEVELIVNEMGIKHISFNDDVLTLNRIRIIEICDEIIKRKIKFTWEGLSRADTVDRDVLTLMKEAGFSRISFGIETGNEKILEILRKGESHEQLRNAFKIAREAGIVTRGSVIVGLPYETRQTVRDTERFIKKLYGLDQLVVNICTPYPGTKLRAMVLAKEGGTRLLDFDISSLRRFGNAVIEVNDLKKDDIIRLQKSLLRSFYLSPNKIFRNFVISGFMAFLKDGISFISSLLKKS